jgi:adenine-specific DNA-methyltransferase
VLSDVFERIEFEYMEADGVLVALGDCLDILKCIKDKQVDLIFADPPYNLGKDFGNGSDNWENREEYLEWCYAWIDECFRVLRDEGTFYIMNSTQNMSFISVYLQEKYNIINDIVWVYDSSGVQSKKKYGSLYEPIVMANKNSSIPYTFNWEDILVEAKTGAKRKLIDYRKTPPQPYNTKKVPFSKSTNVGKSVTNFVMHGTVYALRRSSPLQPGAQPECVLFPQHVQVPALSCLKQCGSVHCCTSQKTL